MNNKRINFNKKQYISRNERLSDMFDNGQIGLDDTFETSCRHCYGCCTYKDAVPMSAYDIFRCAKELNMSTVDFIKQYCWITIGETSLLPVLQLKNEPKLNKCILLKNGVCKVGNSRPTTCALFPLGRFVQIDETNGEKKMGYIFNGDSGCRKARSYTVREWLETNGISADDRIFLLWAELVEYASEMMKKIQPYDVGKKTLNLFHQTLIHQMYAEYDTNKNFIDQLIKNTETIKNAFDPVPQMIHKEYCKYYGHAPKENWEDDSNEK